MLKEILGKFFIRRAKYQPLVKVLVFANRLLDNYRLYCQRYPGMLFAPVLKSNAYGHGLLETARVLSGAKPPFFVVDSYFEALRLKRANIRVPVLVIGYSSPEQIQQGGSNGPAYAITSLDVLKTLASGLRQPRRLHLKIDTGMHRQGIACEEIGQAIALLKKNPNLVAEGVCSHLADADNEGSQLTKRQIEDWNRGVRMFRQAMPQIKYYHLAASEGVAVSRPAEANMARLGLGLYGYGSMPGLKPALEMRTIITSVREIPAGEAVGYSAAFRASGRIRSATIPVGYFEGLDRRLSGKGEVKYRGAFCKILGRVSMNIASFDVTSFPEAKIGEEVVVISSGKGDRNSAAGCAEICQTIAYEILAHIPQHLRREVSYE